VAIYTLFVWTVKPGREQAFVDAWNALGVATTADFPGASGVLLRDRDAPSTFISSGPWESFEQIEAWRGSETFRDGVSRIRELIDGFEPHTMDVAASVGP
jgi:heme-degrading monooxygenase HmoA